jgi:simple sugar transport system permease protein
MRWAGVLISGGFAGLAGGYLSIELVGLYREGMNQGRGFIALAALILGNWSPIGAALSCLLFAWTEALTCSCGSTGSTTPSSRACPTSSP